MDTLTDRNTPMQLNRDRLHVWCASLEISSLQLGELERTLDDSEITRANKFYFERDRRRFVAARGMLRAILANYLETTPSALRFSYNEFGKPSLEGSAEIRDLRFNVSHSGGLVLIAVALARDVGVDIEMINPSVRTDEVARSFFSPNKVATLARLPQALRPLGFFNCWTRKEAYIKARGMGLSIPLDSFDVSLNPGEAAEMIRTANFSYLSNWRIEHLEINSCYAAAVAAAGHDWKLTRWDWP
jgi:4'-phosphopantetheinyl transferase